VRTLAIRWTIVVALGALLPAAAPAVEWDGRLGLSWSRYDESSGGVSASAARLDIDVGLDLRGFAVAPGVVDWQAGAAFRRLSDSGSRVRSTYSNVLDYRLELALFRNRTSPLTLVARAQRTEVEFSALPDPDAAGTRLLQTAGATVSYQDRNRPDLQAGYLYRDLRERIPGLADHDQQVHEVTGGVHASADAFTVLGRYRGAFSDGTWESDQYDDHQLMLDAVADLPGGARLYVTDQYYRRLATSAALTGFSQEFNSLQTGFRYGERVGEQHQWRYLYGHGITERAAGSGVPPLETTRQSMRYDGDFGLATNLFIRGLAELTMAQTRSVLTERSTGETVGAQLWWRRVEAGRFDEVRAGPLLGFVQSDLAEREVGYGAVAAARTSRPWGPYTLGASLDLTYESDLRGVRGWYLSEAAAASLSGPLGRAAFNLQLTGTAVRSWSPVLGDGATRSLALSGALFVGEHRLDAQAGLQSGLVGASPGSFAGDGLFLPAPFDSHAAYAWLAGTWRVWYGISARGQVRWSRADVPGQPALDALEGLASLSYAWGALTLGVEDRLGRTETAGGSITTNLIMLRLTRTLGSGY